MTNSSCKDCNSEDPFISAEKQIEEEKRKEKLIEEYTKKQHNEYNEWEKEEIKKAEEIRYNLVSNGEILKENLTREEQTQTITQWGIDIFNKNGSITPEDVMNLNFEPIIKEES